MKSIHEIRYLTKTMFYRGSAIVNFGQMIFEVCILCVLTTANNSQHTAFHDLSSLSLGFL